MIELTEPIGRKPYEEIIDNTYYVYDQQYVVRYFLKKENILYALKIQKENPQKNMLGTSFMWTSGLWRNIDVIEQYKTTFKLYQELFSDIIMFTCL